MKRAITILAAMIISAVAMNAQTTGDDILGTYLSENGTGKVEVTKADGKYIGTLIWTKDEGALDVKNPDKSLRSRVLAGTVILKNMAFDESKGEWKGGTIYDPESGNTYKATIKRKPNGDLTLRGYVGVPALGRNSAWTKVKP
ncbi:MAG: DUF2147 domain-containing protein [Candidatus Cryptobacteroides sp.]